MANRAALKALSIPVSYLPRSGPIVRSLAPRENRVARQRFRDGAVFDLDLSDRIQAEAFVRRSYERALCRWISRRLGSGDVFVDVGANVGMVSFPVAMTGARVLAFEPDPGNCERWLANHALNPSANAELVKAAVGDHAGSVRLCIGRESGWGRVADDGDIDVRQVTLDACSAEHGIDRIAVLKVDVEGYEPAVLRGAGRLLGERRIDAVVCEVTGFDTAGETVALLAEHGYRPAHSLGLDRAFLPSA